jgi:hypothetical protein
VEGVTMGTFYEQFVSNLNTFFEKLSSSYQNFQLENFLVNKNTESTELQLEQEMLDDIQVEDSFEEEIIV